MSLHWPSNASAILSFTCYPHGCTLHSRTSFKFQKVGLKCTTKNLKRPSAMFFFFFFVDTDNFHLAHWKQGKRHFVCLLTRLGPLICPVSFALPTLTAECMFVCGKETNEWQNRGNRGQRQNDVLERRKSLSSTVSNKPFTDSWTDCHMQMMLLLSPLVNVNWPTSFF